MSNRLFAVVEKHGSNWDIIHKDHFPEWTERALSLWYDKFKGDRSGTEGASGSYQRRNPDQVQENSSYRGLPLWTDEEIQTLRTAVQEHGTDWDKISKEVFRSSRSARAVMMKYERIAQNREMLGGSEKRTWQVGSFGFYEYILNKVDV
jgi:hypothetical protein